MLRKNLADSFLSVIPVEGVEDYSSRDFGNDGLVPIRLKWSRVSVRMPHDGLLQADQIVRLTEIHRIRSMLYGPTMASMHRCRLICLLLPKNVLRWERMEAACRY